MSSTLGAGDLRGGGAEQSVQQLEEAWGSVAQHLTTAVGIERYRRWLACLKPLSWDGAVVKIGTPNRFILEWVEARYLDHVKAAVEAVLGEGVRCELRISGPLFREARKSAAESSRTGAEDVDEPLSRQEPLHPEGRHQLESFVPGLVNRSAYRAVLQTLTDEQLVFNPLVVFGLSGTGKTHLLQGLTHAYRRAKRSARVHYVSAYDFSGSFRTSLLQKRIKRFRTYYRSLDLLAIDDFQLFCAKVQAQEEFLHTFDALVNRGGRVVIALTRHPADIDKVSPRLKQRLLGGLVLRLREPDFPTRLSIIRGETVRMKHSLCNGVMEFLARHVRRNVRELIGAVTRLSAYAALEGREIGVTEARKLLADQLGNDHRDDLPQRIIQAVCEGFRLRPDELLGASRRRRVVQARKLAFYLLRTSVGLSLREIGELVGGRKAPTVRAAVRDVEEELKKGGEASRRLAELKRVLGLSRS